MKILRLFSAATVCIVAAPASTAGLAGYWTFDDAAASTSAADLSGNANDGHCGGVLVYDGDGRSRSMECPTLGGAGQ